MTLTILIIGIVALIVLIDIASALHDIASRIDRWGPQ